MSITTQDKRSTDPCFDLLRKFTSLCRRDAYGGSKTEHYDAASHRPKISYKKRLEPLSDDALHRHLNGGPFVGVYPISPGDNRTSILVFDIDDHDGELEWDTMREAAARLRDIGARHNLRLVGVRSGGGRGIHLVTVWYEPQVASDVRQLAKAVLKEAGFGEGTRGLSCDEVEIFPKESSVQRGRFGSLIAAPFGRASVPLNDEFLPIEDPLPWVSSGDVGAPPAEPVRKRAAHQIWSGDDIKRLRSALAALPSDDYTTWVNYGHALKRDLSEAGWSLWLEWSQKAANFEGEEATRRKWDQLGHGDRENPITAASIFHDAIEAGWQDPDRIIVRPGLYHEAAEVAKRRLVEAGAAIYQRSGALVRVARSPAKDFERNDIAVPAIVPITKPLLSSEMARATQWFQLLFGKKPVRCEPVPGVVDKVFDAFGDWPFPPLFGCVGTPTMRPDGSLLTVLGYDTATGYYLFEPPTMPAVPAQPSKADAEKALAVLDGLLGEFPFVAAADRSVALSGILTTVCRAALDVAPIHIVDAPTPGTGKSFLTGLIARIATGERAASVTPTLGNTEENEKRLSAVALTGTPIISIDDCENLQFGPFLRTAVTETKVQVRILGKSEVKTVDNSFTVLVAGNNVRIAADMVRRVVKCRLDANMERPETRAFRGNPEAEIMADRGRFVAVALTIVRAYVVAGFPNVLAPPAGFGRWSKFVRSSLVWLGCADPVETTTGIIADDPNREVRAQVFEAMARLDLIGKGKPASAIVALSVPPLMKEGEAPTGEQEQRAEAAAELRDVLLRIAKSRRGDGIDTGRVGVWLDRNKDLIANGLKLTKDSNDKSRPRWLLTVTAERETATRVTPGGVPDSRNETRF